MDSTALELYLYMGSKKPIIEWLESEGVTTREEARKKLAPIANGNMMSVMALGAGSLHGTVSGVKKVLEHFPEEEVSEEDSSEND
jgi:hypothetical protein|tara:strand:+ start:1692 stop:1946 length:255 start_codon:yes stop_codon:yes gene_type:complete